MKRLIPIVIVFVMMVVPAMAIGASVEGTIQGFTCVTQGKVCPIGQEDPMIAAERVFVLLSDAASNEFYFVPNIDRGIMARHLNENVKINGTMKMDFKSIQAKELYVMNKGDWKKVWDVNLQDDIYRDIFGVHPLGGGEQQ